MWLILPRVHPSIQKYLNQLLSEAFPSKTGSPRSESIGGGSINDTYRIKFNGHQQFFLKVNSVSRYPALFQKEKNGLQFMDKRHVIHVPSVIALGEFDDY